MFVFHEQAIASEIVHIVVLTTDRSQFVAFAVAAWISLQTLVALAILEVHVAQVPHAPHALWTSLSAAEHGEVLVEGPRELVKSEDDAFVHTSEHGPAVEGFTHRHSYRERHDPCVVLYNVAIGVFAFATVTLELDLSFTGIFVAVVVHAINASFVSFVAVRVTPVRLAAPSYLITLPVNVRDAGRVVLEVQPTVGRIFTNIICAMVTLLALQSIAGEVEVIAPVA